MEKQTLDEKIEEMKKILKKESAEFVDLDLLNVYTAQVVVKIYEEMKDSNCIG